MIQLQKSRTIIDQSDIGRLRSSFAESDCVLLPKLFCPELLDFILPRLSQRRWIRRIEKDISAEDVLDDDLALGLLHMISNAPSFLEAVAEIGGCAGVTLFRGRVYRFVPDSVHHDSWHSDVGDETDQRLVGMSVNLGARPYAGGVFQLRSRESNRILFEIANTGLGDATLFRISRQLEHQVTAVTGDVPRTAFAGWFRSGTERYFSALRHAAAQAS